MTLRIITALSLLFFCLSTLADSPSVLDPKSDREYRETLEHLKKMLPEVETKAIYSALMRPYGLLDVQPTGFASDEDKSKFVNFNFGVMSGILGLSRSDIAKLPDVILCNDEACITKRKAAIKLFLEEAQGGLNTFAQSENIFLVGQLSDTIFRINNTFVTGSEAFAYSKSKVAGFIPSSNFTRYKNLKAAPKLQSYINETAELRKVMKQFKVAAVVRSSPKTLDIIFNGVGDNQWGVVIGEAGLTVPEIGKFNHSGFRYDKISPLDNNAFYFQTN